MKAAFSINNNILILFVINALIISFGNFDLSAQVVMDELNGSSLGKSFGITYIPTPNGQGAVFSKANESRIEYPFSMGLPHQGTVEMVINVFNGYYYDNYKLNDKESHALIFSTNPSDNWYIGAMWLDVNQNGTISLSTSIGNGVAKSHVLTATETSFKFNEWHTISFSYGGTGQYIKVDGKLVAADPSFKENLETCGGGYRNERDNPIVGEERSVVWPNNQYDHGFYGILDRFRASPTQQDWVLNLVDNNRGKEISKNNLAIDVLLSMAFDELLTGIWKYKSGSTVIAEYPLIRIQSLSKKGAESGFIISEILYKDFEWDGSNFFCLSKLKGNGKEDWVKTKITPYSDRLILEYLGKSKIFYSWNSRNDTLLLIPQVNRSLTGKIKKYVERQVNEWQIKGEFEKTTDYLARVNEKTRDLRIEEFQNEAIDFYKKLYAIRISSNDFSLGTYDADNESYLIQSSFLGEFVLPVSLADAPIVKLQFSEMKFSNTDFFIKDDNFILSHIEFRNPSSTRTYIYDCKNKAIYNTNNINYKFDDIKVDLENELEVNNHNVRRSTTLISVGKSDIDTGIPTVSTNKNRNRFALIIGNEDYKSFQPDLNSEANVLFAENDAKTFKEYALQTIGVPEENINLLINATSSQMNQALAKMNLIAKNSNGKAELIFYYAGHGLPDENTKEPYLIPVDVSGANFTEGGIKLSTVYEKLTQYLSQKVSVFIDACFTGGARNQELLAARGIKMKPKEMILTGNIVVFSASSGEQSSLPYKEKQHGMFTYYLLKKIQETKGDVSMKELSDYVKEQVSLQSVNINNKEQTPIVNAGSDNWGDWEIR